MVRPGILFCTLLTTFQIWIPGAIARPIQVEVAAPEAGHIARVSARYLAGLDAPPGADLMLAGNPGDPADPPGARLYILSQNTLAR